MFWKSIFFFFLEGSGEERIFLKNSLPFPTISFPLKKHLMAFDWEMNKWSLEYFTSSYRFLIEWWVQECGSCSQGSAVWGKELIFMGFLSVRPLYLQGLSGVHKPLKGDAIGTVSWKRGVRLWGQSGRVGMQIQLRQSLKLGCSHFSTPSREYRGFCHPINTLSGFIPVIVCTSLTNHQTTSQEPGGES